jgi:tetratricopeptide (TPR) repeat protein
MPAAPAPAEADELTSSTLAELYFNQGFTDKAIEVYRQLLQREPRNERARTRLAELESLDRRLEEEEARVPLAGDPGAGDTAAARRQAIERTIARLEGLLGALRKE